MDSKDTIFRRLKRSNLVDNRETYVDKYQLELLSVLVDIRDKLRR